MFPSNNHNQSTLLYGKDIYENLIPESHILYRIAKEVDFSSYLWLNNLSYVKPLLETNTLIVYEIKP